METRRLKVLLELSRHGSMAAVADVLGSSTSTVSQQVAALAREVGTPLVEPDGRRVRLTPAGRRLADRAVTILAAVEAAQLDLDPAAEPAGVVRVCGFATAIRSILLPIMLDLATSHPAVRVVVHEHEPEESLALLAGDRVDLALTYDYNLAPAPVDLSLQSTRLSSTSWGLGVPAAAAAGVPAGTMAVFRAFRHESWIGNSRNRADEDVLRTLGSMAGFEPRLTHSADSLDLVAEMIVAGLGVGLLPSDRSRPDGVTVLPLSRPDLQVRAYARTRHGWDRWPPLALLLERLIRSTSSEPADMLGR
jgi:DNA-binding transcriptional LysR family regulator